MVSASSNRSHQTVTDEDRPAHLDLSALSSTEYDVYPQWLQTIKPARSGEPDHVEEQDALRFLREECRIEVQDEIKVSTLEVERIERAKEICGVSNFILLFHVFAPKTDFVAV